MHTELASGACPPSATILLVDDHEIFRRTLRDWLGIVFPKTRVLEATTGEEALALIEDDSPDIVLMDITLPGINGLEATRRIRTTHPSSRIVMLTVHNDMSYRAHASAAGACAFVSKQAIRSELKPTLTKLLADNHRVESTNPVH